MKKMLLLNLGSTSFKMKLFLRENKELVCASGGVENIGGGRSRYKISYNNKDIEGSVVCKSCRDAFLFSINILSDEGCIDSIAEIEAVAYKAVHGGDISGTVIVDDEIIRKMEDLSSLAPAHNPVYIDMMKMFKTQYPEIIQIARFETSFHMTIPEYRQCYGVPFEWRRKYGIRKYGFHGSSHEYISLKMKELEPDVRKIISIHLGGSSSLCAIMDGKSIASSMGATPQSGIFQNNRVGDIDAYCIPAVIKYYGNSLESVLKVLSTESGLKGLSGVSNDLREILKERDKGNPQADIAVKSYVDGIVGYIGMFSAYLKGLDAIVFTGGIGINSSIIREMVCESLEYMGVMIDREKNKETTDANLNKDDSIIKIWCLKTDEELIVAKKAEEVLI